MQKKSSFSCLEKTACGSLGQYEVQFWKSRCHVFIEIKFSLTTHVLLHSLKQGGHSPEKGACGPQDPLFTPLLPFTRQEWLICHYIMCSDIIITSLHYIMLRHKSVHKTHIWKKNVTFPSKANIFFFKHDNFSSRSSNLTTIFVKKLENFARNQF